MKVEDVITQFAPISLAEMDQVKLMNRTDRKYWFNKALLAPLLKALSEQYYVLEIDGQRCLPYVSTYYDTPEDQMYYEHHRGKLNRFKIRKRKYESSGISFLEVKFKNNKGRTIKTRIPAEYDNAAFDPKEENFIAQNSPFDCHILHTAISNRFKRITLVNKNMKERCTIDQELTYHKGGKSVKLEELIIVEVKTEGHSAHSAMIEKLKEQHILPSGFSKYCIGRSILEPNLKSNRFKTTHRQIEKKLHTSIHHFI